MNKTDIERARHLIPGFLKKTLPAIDSEWMEQFLHTLHKAGGHEASEFDQEMAWVERTQADLARNAPAFDTQTGWQRLQARLNTVASTPATEATETVPPRKRSFMNWVKSQIRARVEKFIRMWQKPAIGVLASAMIVGQMGLLAALVRYTYNIEPQSSVMAPASGSKVDQDSIVLAVVFKDKATAKQIQQLLSSVQAQVTGGPGAIGVWEVAVPKDKLNDAMKILGSSKIVESAVPQ